MKWYDASSDITTILLESVKEVGPWNEDDNYWNSPDHPDRPRRRFGDLARFMPEAEAAYYNNYNNGKDQFGRTVLNPAGVDLSHETAKALRFPHKYYSAWIDMSWYWED